MARSGYQDKIISSDGYDRVRFSWTLTEQNSDELYSVISWSLQLRTGTYGELISSEKKRYYVNVGDNVFSGESDINVGNNSTASLASGSVKLYHNEDGTKGFSFWWEQDFDVFNSAGELIPYSSDNGSFTIDKIDVLSTLTASNGTLGKAQTITVSSYDSMYVHKLKYSCGSVSGYLAGSDSSYMGGNSVTWTPPLSLASQSTKSTKVSIKLILYTYSGSGVLIGQTTKTISCAIPSSVKPSCTLSVSDLNGYAAKYGFYVKSQSQLKIDVTPTTAYGSAIASYEITADGATYTEASVETDVLGSSGILTITAKVTDRRGRSGTASANITVYDYTAPTITQLKVNRCNSDGSENDKGEYIKVTFGGTVTALDGKNTAYYQLDYKPTYETNYTNSVALNTYDNMYSVTNAEYIFAAATGSSYAVAISITDDFQTSARTTGASTALTLMHWGADGESMGIGKIAEVPKGLDIGFKTRFYGGILHRVIDSGTYLNDLTVANTYVGEDVSNANYGNLPDDLDAEEFLLEVKGNNDVIQVLTEMKENGREFIRYCADANVNPNLISKAKITSGYTAISEHSQSGFGISCAGDQTGVVVYGMFEPFSLKPNTNYTMSFTAWLDTTDMTASQKTTWDLWPDTLPQEFFEVTATPQKFSWTVSSSEADMANCKIRFFIYEADSEGYFAKYPIYITDIKFEESDTATSWTNAPEDGGTNGVRAWTAWRLVGSESQGESGDGTASSSFLTFDVDADGNLYMYSTGGSAPDFEYDEATGNLYYVTEVS